MNLADLLRRSAQRFPERVAVHDSQGALTYRELDARIEALVCLLRNHGFRTGDRLVIWCPKSRRGVIAMQAALRLGGAYVPVDPQGSPLRAARIVRDCEAAAVIVGEGMAFPLDAASPCRPVVIGGGSGIDWPSTATGTSEPDPATSTASDDLAYILYTSGSTGTPKGVCISHAAALAFVDWAVRTLEANEEDRFANHAAFHFDLSVLDLYAAFAVGGAVHLVPEQLAYRPAKLVEFITERGITIWYSVPTALVMMMTQGGLFERIEAARFPRAVAFAGEVFPIAELRRLVDRYPDSRYWNLYGPTETNVCTAFEVVSIDPTRNRPVPIGVAVCGDEASVIRADGGIARVGEVGELWIAGPTVMKGYWGRPPHPGGPYATGDLVRVLDDGALEFVSRTDDMIKIRGVRMEPGEIEATLVAHPDVGEAAVLAVGTGLHKRLLAFITPAATRDVPPLLDLKRHCASRLPRAMVIDDVRVCDQLPRNGNGKLDRSALRLRAENECHERRQSHHA